MTKDQHTLQDPTTQYTTPTFDKQAQQVVDDASYQGRYVALMTSLHASYIYQCKGEGDPAFANFLAEQKTLQRRWLRALGLSARQRCLPACSRRCSSK